MKSKYWVYTQFCLEMFPKEISRETLQERQRKFNWCHLCQEFPKVLCVLCLRDSTLSYRQLGICFKSFLQVKEYLLFQVNVTYIKFKSRLLEEHTPLQASYSSGCQMLVIYRVGRRYILGRKVEAERSEAGGHPQTCYLAEEM